MIGFIFSALNVESSIVRLFGEVNCDLTVSITCYTTLSKMPTDQKYDTEHVEMLDLYEHPGHLLRRAQQISVSIFYDEMGDELTPVQYAILNQLALHPGIDQVSLAGLAAIDTSTGASVCARLEEKGLLERRVIPHNRRQRALTITASGATMLGNMEAGALRLRERLLGPLTPREQRRFMELLAKLVQENNAQSRAPLSAPSQDSGT
jgi:DNA-binding MarR family transcriptional regulator